MGQASRRAAPDGRYWIDVAVGTYELLLMVDLGLTDQRNQVGLELDPVTHDRLKLAGAFSRYGRRLWRDARGRSTHTETGLTTAQLIDPVTRQRVGPAVSVYANKGFGGVPARVGVVFFHLLGGCRVIWALDTQTWTVDYP
jgi:hypothetical protein